MRILSIFVIVFSTAFSSPLKENGGIVKYQSTADGHGSYSFSYETSDGTFREEYGVLKNADDPEKAYVAVNGRYSYIAPDGKTYIVTYNAGKDGFQPEGEHIPKIKTAPVKLPPVTTTTSRYIATPTTPRSAPRKINYKPQYPSGFQNTLPPAVIDSLTNAY